MFDELMSTIGDVGPEFKVTVDKLEKAEKRLTGVLHRSWYVCPGSNNISGSLVSRPCNTSSSSIRVISDSVTICAPLMSNLRDAETKGISSLQKYNLELW